MRPWWTKSSPITSVKCVKLSVQTSKFQNVANGLVVIVATLALVLLPLSIITVPILLFSFFIAGKSFFPKPLLGSVQLSLFSSSPNHLHVTKVHALFRYRFIVVEIENIGRRVLWRDSVSDDDYRHFLRQVHFQ